MHLLMLVYHCKQALIKTMQQGRNVIWTTKF